MSLWLLLTIPALWLAICATAVALCVMAARGDRGNAARLRAVPVDPSHGTPPTATRTSEVGVAHPLERDAPPAVAGLNN